MQSANIALKSDILSEIRVISTRLTPCRDTQNTRRRRMYILSCKLLLLLRFSVYLLPLLARCMHSLLSEASDPEEEAWTFENVQRWQRTAATNHA